MWFKASHKGTMVRNSDRLESQGPSGPTAGWRGTERYQVIQRIGEGGMGVVYEALDLERHQPVAVKTLQRFSPDALYRFKQEFRTLADLIHPNLVRLYDLVASDEEGVFFTMELIRGTTFIEHVLSSAHHSAGPVSSAATARPVRDALGAARSSEPPLATPGWETLKPSPADPARLRPALRQLAEGVHALHLAGKLHRDIKPSNILVTREGRVVILDFGVATEMGRAADADLAMVGTARYMAPEQATDGAPTSASDWYSVGVMLFEALVGQVPFAGSVVDVLTRKSMMDPPAPRDCAEGVPPDLDLLCTDLLRRVPSDRPSGAQVLDRLGRRSVGPTPLPPAQAIREAALVGRDTQLEALADAFEGVRQGNHVTVLVNGGAGMGKSALVRRFLDDVSDRDAGLVLRGRVYQRETVPYNVFDSLMDSLTRHLRGLVEAELEPLLADVSALGRLFPVLGGVADVSRATAPAAEPLLVRRRAFAALPTLLSGLRRRGPVVVCIEDVHWGDRDSVGLLLEALRAPILLVLTHQDGAEGSSPFLDEMRARWPARMDRRRVSVGPLDAEDARLLALSLLGSDDSGALVDAEVIAADSGGSPFLVEELVRNALSHERTGRRTPQASMGAVTLEKMVSDRLSRIDAPARRLLELVAVGGRPLPVSLVGKAAGLEDEIEDIVAQLRTRRLVRIEGRGGRDWIEISHGRIAEAILAPLPSDVIRGHHARLALILEDAPGTDAEALALHLLGSGEDLRAAEWAERAAEDASVKLAFEKAARLFKLAIRTRERADPTSATLPRLRMRLGEADAHLSSAELEGPLKEQVDELLGMEREIDLTEQAIANLRELASGGARSSVDAQRQIADLEEKLAFTRARFREAVLDLPLDAPTEETPITSR
jgi:serine/threonine protein kinase